MNTSSLRHRIFVLARNEFMLRGVIPADLAAQLMQHGYIVPELERTWLRQSTGGVL